MTTTLVYCSLESDTTNMSSDMNISYYKEIFPNEEYVYALCQMENLDKSIAFTTCLFYTKDMTLFATAKHNKYIIRGKPLVDYYGNKVDLNQTPKL